MQSYKSLSPSRADPATAITTPIFVAAPSPVITSDIGRRSSTAGSSIIFAPPDRMGHELPPALFCFQSPASNLHVGEEVEIIDPRTGKSTYFFNTNAGPGRFAIHGSTGWSTHAKFNQLIGSSPETPWQLSRIPAGMAPAKTLIFAGRPERMGGSTRISWSRSLRGRLFACRIWAAPQPSRSPPRSKLKIPGNPLLVESSPNVQRIRFRTIPPRQGPKIRSSKPTNRRSHPSPPVDSIPETLANLSSSYGAGSTAGISNGPQNYLFRASERRPGKPHIGKEILSAYCRWPWTSTPPSKHPDRHAPGRETRPERGLSLNFYRPDLWALAPF